MILKSIYIPCLPEIKKHFRLQVSICDPGNRYAKLYDIPKKDHEITELDQREPAVIDFPKSTALCGDAFFKLMHRSKKGNDKLICRFGLNTSFLRCYEGMQARQLSLNLDRFLVDPDAVRKTKGYEKS